MFKIKFFTIKQPLLFTSTAIIASLALIAAICFPVAAPLQQEAYAAQGNNYAAGSSGALTSTQTNSVSTAATNYPSYTITPKTESPNKKLRKSNTYTKQLKNYWVMSWCMEMFEKKGGGTLTLKKGTYQLPVSVQVPSNVKIIFEDGVVIKKTGSTGTTRVRSNSPLFQMVSPSKYKLENAVTKYNGTKNVSFVSKGNVIFDMNKRQPGCAIIMAQNQKMSFTGITFKNLAEHAFELDASKNVVIDKCKFLNGVGGKTAEAINLDTPDAKTGGFSFRWSKKDKNPNQGVTIKNCTFKNVVRGIGTHKYSQTNSGVNVMHSNIKILNNTFIDIAGVEGCVVPFNWKNVTIKGNTFKGKGQNTDTYAIVAHSVQNITIANNTISNYQNSIAIRRGYSASGYKSPAPISVNDDQVAALSTNKYATGTVTYSDASITTEPCFTTITKKYYPLIAI